MHSVTKALVCDHKKAHYLPSLRKERSKTSMFGMPTQEAFQSGKWHIAGCEPDFPRHRDWGCNNCDAAFFKESESVVDSFNQKNMENKLKKKGDPNNEIMCVSIQSSNEGDGIYNL